ncbi:MULTISPECIES: hypothetical protein [unclassified Streptomyces]|uniref:hypothetical protein n=1 Tax=unclassified Streptomyces TaxID=2593676 RepID=UPI002DD90CE6|nr:MULTISPECIES: hypothetical protein [unclassified Streptomyces]WSA91634.1 hypothetical protein OIE63_08710 [Streptomyces sp. NBC_01795]WSB76005.1 hypothetical protein OHB04_09515 [Streptomyces sp. NBC_01775]WSS15720.1 hypothetical protein OG533_30420 [Streptomyces sp. NBC_01186]WSS44560.1 hypothetical protein OG220_31210 [Streptomyces sp. NBC_01187]
MNAATVSLLGVVAAAVIAASAAVVGPLILQRRKERVEESQRLQDETTRRMDLVNDVGVHCREWLLYLVRSLRDTEAGRTIAVAEFDEKCQALRFAAEDAFARTSSAGYELSDSGLADTLRDMETQVRDSLLRAAPSEHLTRLRTEATGYFTPRAIVRLRMLDEVSHRQAPTDPLAGTVFEQRRLPRS